MTTTIANRFFARIWPVVATHETEAIRALRRQNLAGSSGRVLEVGAGTNFPHYPASVDEVIAVEPEPRLAVAGRRRRRGGADGVLRRLYSLLRPGGQALSWFRVSSAAPAAAAAARAKLGSPSRAC